MYVQVFIIMHRVKTCRATRLRQKNFRRRADRRQQSSRAARSSQTAVPSSGRAGDPNRSSAGASPARLRPRSGHSPPAPRPRAPPARIQALLAPARPPAVAPRASPGPPPVRSRDARVRLPGGCPRPSAPRRPRPCSARSRGDPHGPGHLRAHRARLRALAHHQGDPGAPRPRPTLAAPGRARAPRPPREGFVRFPALRSPFPAIAPRIAARPLSDRPSTLTTP